MSTAARRLLIAASGGGGFSDLGNFYGPNPDKPPTSPSAYDEEFTQSSLSGSWSAIDPALTNTYDMNSAVESCLVLDGDDTNGFYKPCPSTPFTVTAKIAGYANAQGTSVRTDVGLFLGEATPGKFIHGCLDIAEDNYFCIVGSTWTSPTVYGTNIGDFLNSGSGAGSRARNPAFGYMRPMWTRFVVNSTTDVDGYFSFDGNLYTPWLTAYDPGFTIGSVGLDIHGFGTAAAIDYLRFE